LYLRQPGYGTSYVTGKYFMEQLVMDMGVKEDNHLNLYHFFDKLYATGILPLSLVRWEMTGDDGEIKSILNKK